MKIIARMLTRMVLTRFLAILFGVSMFVIMLEMVTFSREIGTLRPDDFSIYPVYMLVRLPVTLSTFLPISMLLAMLLTLTELSYRNEIASLWATGISPLRLIRMLLPLALVAGAAHFALGNYVIPKVSPQLRTWAVGDYGKGSKKNGAVPVLWMRAGNDILRVEYTNADSTVLTNIIVFRRDAGGLLHQQIYAKEAVNESGEWIMKNVDIYSAEGNPVEHHETLVYDGAMTPAAAGKRAGEPEEMSMQDLRYFVENRGFGLKPVWVYQTWWFKRVSLFFTALVMIALCIPLATRFRRGGGLGSLFIAGVAFGFLFFVADGISVTLGELGFVTPWFAAWFPVIGFMALAASLAFRAERV
jgi:lipopolysaccharide export system permease protein